MTGWAVFICGICEFCGFVFFFVLAAAQGLAMTTAESVASLLSPRICVDGVVQLGL